MKVLLVHNFYQSSSPSGEDAVYRNEVALLRSKEVAVVLYEKHNDRISGTLNRAKTVSDSVWSKKTYQEVSELIEKEKPDIAHFHNIWYLISPSAYAACREAGVPVVQTLHNFRMFCANGLLMRDGRVCEDCIGRTPWRGIAYGCYRGSRLYSVPVVASEIIHRARRTWAEAVDAYVALTEFGKRKFVECGLPAEKLFVKPNFLADPPAPNYTTADYAIYMGRLSEEKGLDVLVDALASDNGASSLPLKVKIVGEGPMRAHLEGKTKDKSLSNIEFLGRKDFSECLDLLSHARFMIMPSVCYENFPMAIREAFACGKPVVASRLGAMAEIVEENRTGLLFAAGDSADLAAKMQRLTGDSDACIKMGKNARSEFESKYTADRNFEMLMDIYRHAISISKN
jgi:glycosyltransferase involved in cell wall biosynthesis